VFAEGTGLSQHGINQRGLAVVYVGHDCNVSKVISDCQSHKKLPLYLRSNAPIFTSNLILPNLSQTRFASQEASLQV
jgi:hypothetical protein